MRHNTRQKIYIWGALLVLLLLVSGLPGLTFSQHRLFDLASTFDMKSIVKDALYLARFVFTVCVILLVLFLASEVRNRWAWLSLAAIGLLLLFFAWGATTVSTLVGTPELPPPPTVLATRPAEVLEEPMPEVPLLETEALPAAPAWITWLVNFSMTFLLLALVVAAAWFFWPRRPEPSPLADLSHEADAALAALESGGDLRNVVLRCYMEMSRILDESHSIRRAQAMTPREFEGALAQLGLPAAPVAALTRLFEAARYGVGEPDAAEEQEAVLCLTAVAVACQEVA